MRLSLATVLAAAAITLQASEPAPVRPVLSAYTVHAGSAHIAETYLSPLKYSGQAFGLGYERMQAMKFNPEHWVQTLDLGLDFARTLNPARNATTWQLMLEGAWSMTHRWKLHGGWSLYAGGNADLQLGVLYNRRNSNNPAAAKAAFTIGATVAAARSMRLGSLPVTFRYRLRMPLSGMFFSPQYGELYYEIYLGNRSGLVRAAWPGNFLRLDNLLSADLHFGATTLRLGYRLDYSSSKASHIVTRRLSHCAVVGITCEWISLGAGSRVTPALKTINALY